MLIDSGSRAKGFPSEAVGFEGGNLAFESLRAAAQIVVLRDRSDIAPARSHDELAQSRRTRGL